MSAPSVEAPPQTVTRPASALVSDVIRFWPPDEPFSARAILERHPDWTDRASLVIDLACEEFSRRTKAGERLQIADFVRDYAPYAGKLRQLILIDQGLASQPFLRAGQAFHWPAAGDVIAGFPLREALGRGALSRVFLADDPLLERQVVLKFVPHQSAEAQLQARIEHPHVMPVHAVYGLPERGLDAICMPFVGRATLCELTDAAARLSPRQRTTAQVAAEFVRHGWLDPLNARVQKLVVARESFVEWALRIGVALAEALAQAQVRGVSHRDIKPSNVLLTFTGEPVLLDFNLASGQTAISGEGGTIPYMPPERLQAWLDEDPASVNGLRESADIYALGATLFEMLAGQLPFAAPENTHSRTEQLAAMLNSHHWGHAALSRLNPGVNASLAALIETTLRTDPAARPASPAEFAAGLRAELGLRQRGTRFVLSHRTASAAGALAVAAALVVTPMALSGMRNREAVDRAAIRNQPLEVLRGRVLRNPYDVDARRQLGLACLEQGQAEEALQHFQAALRERQDGYTAALAGVAALRDPLSVRFAPKYLKQADDLGYDSIAHQNNWSVYELSHGKSDEARARLTKLLDKAHPELRPVILGNCLQAEFRSRLSNPQPIDLLPMPLGEYVGEFTPWHHWRLANLHAAALKFSPSVERYEPLRRELFLSMQRARAGGVPSERFEVALQLSPQLADDPRWHAALATVPTTECGPEPEATLIPGR